MALTDAQKKRALVVLCACGAQNPMHRGYCTECVTKMKSKFDALVEKYAALKEEYDNFNSSDVDKADEKLRLMRAKAEQYEIELNDVQMLDVMEAHSKLMGTDDKKLVAELKVRSLIEKQEQEILIFKTQVE